MAVDDVGLRTALGRVGRFLRSSVREIAGIFGVVLLLVLLATAASILATAGLGLIGFVPIVAVAVMPLQIAAWLVRGAVFELLREGPLTGSELGQALAARWKDRQPASLAALIRNNLPLVHLPPAGSWNSHQSAQLQPIGQWLGESAAGHRGGASARVPRCARPRSQ